MNKQELISAIAEKTELSKADSEKALNAFTDSIKESLAQGENAQLVGFGTFSVSERAARVGRNPATGQEIQIAAKKVVKFKPGKAIDEAVN